MDFIKIFNKLKINNKKSEKYKKSMFPTQSERLATFQGWPVSFIDPIKLSKAGFIWSKKERDEVRCVYCGTGVYNWEEGDDPMKRKKVMSYLLMVAFYYTTSHILLPSLFRVSEVFPAVDGYLLKEIIYFQIMNKILFFSYSFLTVCHQNTFRLQTALKTKFEDLFLLMKQYPQMRLPSDYSQKVIHHQTVLRINLQFTW